MQTVADIRQQAEARATAAPIHVVQIEIGEGVRQGDVYLERIAEVPDGATIVRHPSPQIAPGTTQGSRHVIDPITGMEVYRLRQPGLLDGPVIRATQALTITHPEHGWITVPSGVYAVTYQREGGEVERRVQD